MLFQPGFSRPWLFSLFLLASFLATNTKAQNEVTGAFEGRVSNSQTNAPIAGATVVFTDLSSGVQLPPRRTDAQGNFYQGLLPPGRYTIRASAPGFKTRMEERRLEATRINQVVPIPMPLDPESPVATPTPIQITPSTTPPTQTATAQTSTTQTTVPTTAEDSDIEVRTLTMAPRRGGAFTEEEVATLPLGSSTLVRSFDELALLLPGVALPPQTLGGVAGPGVGAGVGSSGQFAVNGIRSRANNFTVDGSDNNDEDIGVRRQGFLSLIPQPIESIQEYQIITLLAPAQFGRNIGAQVNAISKSGGNETHGTFYGFLNSSQLNARNFFDTTNGNSVSALVAGSSQPVLLDDRPFTVRNESDGEDSFTLGQGGLVLGGPLVPDKMFYFISAEGQILTAAKEVSFAVPTVEQRGVFNTGATGVFRDPLTNRPTFVLPAGRLAYAFQTIAQDLVISPSGNVIFSLFPFPNNPTGVYGRNTFTQTLPASGQGKVLSGKVDGNFKVKERQQSVTARYNFTNDWREIPATAGAIFSTIRPRVRTQNFSTFLNSEVSGPNATRPIYNQLRLSYGRTRLNFEEVRSRTFQIPSDISPSTPFLLNARVILNGTLPAAPGISNTGPVRYISNPCSRIEFLFQGSFALEPISVPCSTVENLLGPVGQINIAGFSPVGVDVFNFPQSRVNNTYQVADTLTLRAGDHSYAFGVDIRRTELNSKLPRNSASIITFNGAPISNQTGFVGGFFFPETLAAASAPSGLSQAINTVSDNPSITLRYYQLNFFAQDEWRVRPNLSLSYGLRYEYNSPPRERNEIIESTFNSPLLDSVPGLRTFIEGRTQIFDPDRNNFAPRVGIAYSPDPFGKDHPTIIRAGYGLFYDQILGAVVSQSRNVFPTFLTVDFAGFLSGTFLGEKPAFGIVNPGNPANRPSLVQASQPGIPINSLNPNLPGFPDFCRTSRDAYITCLLNFFDRNTPASRFGATFPARQLQMPMAHHYNLTFEQQLKSNLVVSAAYVGTLGRRLLRFTTPNLGPNLIPLPTDLLTSVPAESQVPGFPCDLCPILRGISLAPGTRLSSTGLPVGGRPENTVGTIYRFETIASSRYNALQVQARGHLRRSLQYQMAYTFSKVTDDVSDVFDLAGSSALPQNSLTFAGERGPANFDARNRFSYNFIYDFPGLRDRSDVFRFLLGGLQVASMGRFQTGQPFTVNSIFDVNLDGNLTDRLNTTNGINVTGDHRQPLQLATNNTFSLLAPVGQDGAVGRNTFRAGSVLELDMALIKNFAISDRQRLIFRADIFNFINRANFGLPVRFLEAPGFGRATDTITPERRIQIGLKYSF